jgi:hypothetical protein
MQYHFVEKAQVGRTTHFAANGMRAVNPTLAGDNTLLNNQAASEFAVISTGNPAVTNQQLTSELQNTILLANRAPMANALPTSLRLIEQEAVLSTDLALLLVDPALATHAPFMASVRSTSAFIHNNPQFFNPFDFTEAFSLAR